MLSAGVSFYAELNIFGGIFFVAATNVNEAAGERVYVIGDIHGCVDEPAALLRCLEEGEGVTDNDLVIFLGDYVDRGPDTKGVVD